MRNCKHATTRTLHRLMRRWANVTPKQVEVSQIRQWKIKQIQLHIHTVPNSKISSCEETLESTEKHTTEPMFSTVLSPHTKMKFTVKVTSRVELLGQTKVSYLRQLKLKALPKGKQWLSISSPSPASLSRPLPATQSAGHSSSPVALRCKQCDDRRNHTKEQTDFPTSN